VSTLTFTSAAEEIAHLRSENMTLKQENGDLAAKNEWMRRVLYGPSSERRPPQQDHGKGVQQEFLSAPVDAGATADEAEAKQTAREERAERKNAKKGRGKDGQKKPKNGGGRTPVNRSLRPVEQVIAAPESARVAGDGTPLMLLGYEVSEREHYIAAELVRLVIKRERWGLADTREEVVRAAVPPAIVPKGKYSDEYVLEAMLRKYLHGMPFTRMLGDFRAMGSDLEDATLCNLARRFAEFFAPVHQAIRAQVLARPFVHVDETTLPTQDGLRYLWAWVGGRQAFFHVGGRGGRELRAVLGDTRETAPEDADPGVQRTLGFLMADGYAAYDSAAAEHGITRLCCWAHGRRNFLPLENDPFAATARERIDVLFRIEREAQAHERAEGLAPDDAIAYRLHARQTRAVPALAAIHDLMHEHRHRYRPSGDMRKAIDYLLDRWPAFTAYTARGDLPMDNNQAERVIRPIVVGRKCWIFVGSDDATAWAASNHTLFESCRLAGVEPRAYLRYVITALHGGATSADDLTPERCARRFPAPC
jgi:transposase